MPDIKKIASQVPAVLQESAQHMRKLSEDNANLVQENDELRHELRLVKLARRMEERGLEPSLDFDEKVATLRGFDRSKLASFEQAVEITAGGFALGRLEHPDDKTASDSGGGDPLENFVLSHQAYS